MTREPPCPDVETLSAWMDDALGADERPALEAHLRACPACSRLLAQVQALQAAIARLPEVELGVDLAPLVDRRIAPQSAAVRPRVNVRRRPTWWQVALAAPGVVAALGIGALLGSLALGGGATVQAERVQMAAFSANPPGGLCPAPQACQGELR